MTTNCLTECVCDKFDLGPTMQYHIVEGNAPTQYYYFWSIGFVCFIITSIVIIPGIQKIYNEASKIREQQDTALLPFSYIICEIILGFPFIGLTSNFIILIVPISYSIFVFILSLYQAFTLYVFARLLIMYLGSYKSAIKLFRSNKTLPTKFYASPPLCCIKPFIQPKKMTKKDFRIIHYLIQQYMIVGPFIIFLSFFFENTIDNYYSLLSSKIIGTTQIISSVGCLYASQCLLNASQQILNEYEIVGKFRMIQFGIMTLSIPGGLISIIGIDTSINHVYSEYVMDKAWSAIIGVVLYTFLSFGFRKYFNIQTAKNAMTNSANSSYTASLHNHNDNDNDDDNKIQIGSNKEDHMKTKLLQSTKDLDDIKTEIVKQDMINSQQQQQSGIREDIGDNYGPLD